MRSLFRRNSSDQRIRTVKLVNPTPEDERSWFLWFYQLKRSCSRSNRTKSNKQNV
ncbi:hypothetical protein [Mycoplasma suis]|uniref:Uncharacterized protein n=1 Tax=Mycoplasma suis (strain KI_3806) TaxID=708248 RepID=F0V1U6_MYCS3|nr:hypothetical protein [Mycoplasma suis]CBZ40627.1 hypothetical protein MSUIS_05340 [Mycoplasma suis KI3806]